MDKPDIYRDKLTASAKEALKQSVIEFENSILTKASLIAQEGKTGDKEISLRDIIEAKESLFKAKRELEKTEYKRRSMLSLVTLSGAFYSIVGIIIYIFQNRKFDYKTDLGLIIAFIGVLTIFLAFTYGQYFAKNKLFIKPNDYDDEFKVIRRWQLIERMGSNLMRQRGYSNNESHSINAILNFLAHELKDDRLSMDLKELLAYRNKAVHEASPISKHEKQMFLDKSERIIRLLENLEK